MHIHLSVLINTIIQNNGTPNTISQDEKPFYSSSFDFLEDLNQDPNLLPFSPPSFSFCNLSASFAFFNASLACALSEEFEKNEANPTQIGGLSIWVGLASFFSNSSGRAQARDALKKAKEVERLQKEKEGGEKGRRFGSWFRSSKKSNDEE